MNGVENNLRWKFFLLKIQRRVFTKLLVRLLCVSGERSPERQVDAYIKQPPKLLCAFVLEVFNVVAKAGSYYTC